MTVAQREMLVREYGRVLGLPSPMDLLGMLEEALEVYRRHFGVLFGIALIPAVLNTLLTLLAEALQRFPAQAIPLIIALGAVYLMLFVTSFLGYGAQVWVVGKALMGETVGFGEAWLVISKRVVAFTVTLFLGGLAAMLGFCLLCIGVLFTTTIFTALLAQVILLEGVGYFRAIERHLRLVYPDWQWLRVLGFWLVNYLVIFVVQMLIGYVGFMGLIAIEIAREALPVPTLMALTGLSNLWMQVTSALTMPYLVAFVTLLYFDLRARREAADIQILLQRWEGWARSA